MGNKNFDIENLRNLNLINYPIIFYYNKYIIIIIITKILVKPFSWGKEKMGS